MKLYLDTSTPETILKLDNQEYKYVFKNDLAEKLLEFIKDKLLQISGQPRGNSSQNLIQFVRSIGIAT